MKKNNFRKRKLSIVLAVFQLISVLSLNKFYTTEVKAVGDSFGISFDDFSENDPVVNGEEMYRYYLDNGYKGIADLPGTRGTLADIRLPVNSKMPVDAGNNPEDYLIRLKAFHRRNEEGDQVIRWRVTTKGGMEGTGQWVSPLAYVARPYYHTSVSRGLEMPRDIFYYDPHDGSPDDAVIAEDWVRLFRASRYVHNVENNWGDWYDDYTGSDGETYRIMGNDSWSKTAGVDNNANTSRNYMDSHNWFGLTGVSNGYTKDNNGSIVPTNNFNPEKLLKFSKYYLNDWQSPANQHKSRVVTFDTKVNIAEVNAIGSSAGISRSGKNVASNNVYSEFWDLAGRGGDGRVINGQVAEPGMSGYVWVMQGVKHTSNTGGSGASPGMHSAGIYVFQKAEMVRVYTDAEDFQPSIPVNNIIVALRETVNKDNILNYIRQNIVLGNDKRGVNYNRLRDKIITNISWANSDAIPTHTAGVYNAPVRITYKDRSSENINIPITVLPGIKNTTGNNVNKPQDLVIWNNTPLTNTSLVIPVHDGDKNPSQGGLQSMIENVYFVGGGNIDNRILGGLSISNTGAFSGSQNTNFIGIYNANVVVENNVVGASDSKRKAMSTGIWVLIFDAKDKVIEKDVLYPAPTQDEVKQAALSAVNRGNFYEANHSKYPVTATIKPSDISKIPPQYPDKILNPVPVTLRNADGQEKVINVIYKYNVADITSNPNQEAPEGYHKVTFEIPDGQGNLVALNQNVTRKVYLVKNGTDKARILPSITADSNYVLQTQNWRKNGQEGGSDVPNTITESGTYVAYLKPVNRVPVIAKRDIVIWKTDNSNIKTNVKDVIQEQELPITDTPMSIDANNISIIADGSGQTILPTLSFKIKDGKVYMEGYSNESNRYTSKFKVVDGEHTVIGPDFWLYVVQASGGDIEKNIGESVSLEEVLNKATYTTLSELDTSKITKALYDGESLPEVNTNKTVLVKLTYSDPQKSNTQYKLVPVNIYYKLIDRTAYTSVPTPEGYVRITLSAEAEKGQLTVQNQNYQTKVYDVKIGTSKSDIESLVNITPKTNWRTMAQKWKDGTNSDIPDTISLNENNKVYVAQFEQINKEIYLTKDISDIFVWKINENPDASADRYRQMETVNNYEGLPIKDRDVPAAMTDAYFEGNNNKSNVGNLSVVHNNAENTVKISGYANVSPGYYTRKITVKDGYHTFRTRDIWVVVFDASVTPIQKTLGEVVSEDDIKNAVTVNYGTYPNNTSTAANRVVEKEIIEKPENLSKGSYVAKVKLTNAKGMVKVVDVPVSYNLILGTGDTGEQIPDGYVKITLNIDRTKGKLVVNNQDTYRQVLYVKSGTTKEQISSSVSIVPNANWRLEAQNWKDEDMLDLPNVISNQQNNKDYVAQLTEIDKAPYFDKNGVEANVNTYSDKIVVWKGVEVSKDLPIKDKSLPTIDAESIKFVNTGNNTVNEINGLTLGVDKKGEVQNVKLSGSTNENVGLYERRIQLKDTSHDNVYTGTVYVNVIDATANKVSVKYGNKPTREQIEKAISVNFANTNLNTAEKVIRYEFDENTIGTHDGVFGVVVAMTNTSDQRKTIVVPIEYTYEKVTLKARRPVRNETSIEVESNIQQGRKVRLYINKDKTNQVIKEGELNNGKYLFTLDSPLKKGDKVRIEIISEHIEVGTPPLIFTVR